MASTPPPSKPTPAELDLLRMLWPLGSATVKQVHQAMLKHRPDANYATVLRLMQVMHGKGLLIRDESQRSHIYAPSQARDAMRTGLLKELIQKAFSGSGKELVMTALRAHVTDEEREEIQRYLTEDDQ